ncbi:MAG: hypothetical protein WCI03_04125 [bacterium]
MKLRDCIGGEVMIHAKSGRSVRVAAPRKTHGSPSGVNVMYWHTDGSNSAALCDGELNKATIRQQRDFWREAYENLAEEVCRPA